MGCLRMLFFGYKNLLQTLLWVYRSIYHTFVGNVTNIRNHAMFESGKMIDELYKKENTRFSFSKNTGPFSNIKTLCLLTGTGHHHSVGKSHDVSVCLVSLELLHNLVMRAGRGPSRVQASHEYFWESQLQKEVVFNAPSETYRTGWQSTVSVWICMRVIERVLPVSLWTL